MSHQGKVFKKRYYLNIIILSLSTPLFLSGNVQSNMSQQGKGFKQRCYCNIYTLSLCRPVLLSDNIQTLHVVPGERIQTKILWEHLQFKPM